MTRARSTFQSRNHQPPPAVAPAAAPVSPRMVPAHTPHLHARIIINESAGHLGPSRLRSSPCRPKPAKRPTHCCARPRTGAWGCLARPAPPRQCPTKASVSACCARRSAVPGFLGSKLRPGAMDGPPEEEAAATELRLMRRFDG
ncbi:uncharacterized protein K452DRAFT_128185 [Aplosporella prunicola CBS 121167]|uniref:Uncharacterized protein n=1 Tax=Aplosporella prunicola CBS 121167 TaxID=1176127 RepID=A0A6A6B0R2_9PEZI|nr:uncharacterized protein K452DRAFT_128185 [Aplosporella prunicola CBS 121167]KAF2136617.1 hypothetical protein K452DRAFT_128185 [Aplosporella prunicola CBS 121167]